MRGRWREIRNETRGLQFRATLLLMVVVVVATGLSGALFLRISSRIVVDEAKAHSRRVAQSLAIVGARPVLEGDQVATLDIAQRLMSEDEFVYVAFADRSGRVLGGAQRGTGQLKQWLTDDGRKLKIDSFDRPMLVQTEDHSSVIDLLFPVNDGSNEMKGVEPTPVAGYVRVGLSLSRTEQKLLAVTRSVSGVCIGIALLMVPLGYEVVRRLITPLDELAKAAKDVAGGALDRRVTIRRADEIGRLGEAFNGMAEDLSRSHNALIKLNAELEDRVLRRTEQLAESNRLLTLEVAEREELIQVVSHDLHAPLRNIAGQAMLLRRRIGDTPSPEVEHCLERIDHNVRCETEMIDELLELTRLRAARERPQEIDVEAELRSIAAQLEFELDKKRIDFRLEGTFPRIVASRRRFRHVLLNLVDNAIKYTDPAAHDVASVTVSMRTHPDGYEFRVADRGVGIPERERERIFKVFSRGGGHMVTKTPGKGVGLAHCRSVVRAWNGKIWIEDNPGGGSVFCFTIGRLPGDRAHPSSTAPTRAKPRKLEAQRDA